MKNLIRRIALGLSLTIFASFAVAQGNSGGGGGADPSDAIDALQNEVDTLTDTVYDLSDTVLDLSSQIGTIELGDIEDQIGDLSANLQAQIDSLILQVVPVDCGVDSNALQSAIDAAPPAGAIIQASGPCGAIVIDAKRNIIIEGDGSTSINGSDGDSLDGALLVKSSQNVFVSDAEVIAGLNEGAVVVTSSNMALLDSTVSSTATTSPAIQAEQNSNLNLVDSTINGLLAAVEDSSIRTSGAIQINAVAGGDGSAIFLNQSSSFVQFDGFVTSIGRVDVFLGSTLQMMNASIDVSTVATLAAVWASLNSSIRFQTMDISHSVSVTGVFNLFSGSSASIGGDGSHLITGPVLRVQRNSSAFINDTTLDVDRIESNLNATLDLRSVTINEFLDPPDVQIWHGSGIVAIGGTTPVVASRCEPGAWTIGSISCPAPP